jgi:cytochrome c oxidase subunit 2
MKNHSLWMIIGCILPLLLINFIYAETDRNISAQELKRMLNSKEDFILIDVHIPEQRHIQGTDEFIPFNAIEENKDKLPQKDKKIVVYCRSGPMGTQATQELVQMGYTNVYNLYGGIVDWKNAGFNVDGPDRIIYIKAQRFSFTPDVIKIKQGDKVKIILETADVIHGFALAGFNINKRIEPGKKNIIEFIADKKGEYIFRCSVYCGSGHSRMKGKLVVE